MKELKEKLEKCIEFRKSIGSEGVTIYLTYEEAQHLLSSMGDGWVKVDKDNLVTEEVIAYREGEEKVVGYLNLLDSDTVVCDGLYETLYDPTHYKLFFPPTP